MHKGTEEQLFGEIAVKIINAVRDHILSGATPLRTAICKILRSHLSALPTAAGADKEDGGAK